MTRPNQITTRARTNKRGKRALLLITLSLAGASMLIQPLWKAFLSSSQSASQGDLAGQEPATPAGDVRLAATENATQNLPFRAEPPQVHPPKVSDRAQPPMLPSLPPTPSLAQPPPITAAPVYTPAPAPSQSSNRGKQSASATRQALADALSEIQADASVQKEAAREGGANFMPLPGPGTTAEVPSPNASTNAEPDLGWRFMAHLALQDTNSLNALVRQAELNKIPARGWIGIAITLQDQLFKQGLLTTLSAEDILKAPRDFLPQRLRLIQILLAFAQNDSARKSLFNAQEQLRGKAVAQTGGYTDTFSTASAQPAIPLPSTSTNDLSWTLIAQLALREETALTVLLRQADLDNIPNAGWTSIAATLQNESLKEGSLEKISTNDLFTKPEVLLSERLDLIKFLLEVVHNTDARQLLITANSQLRTKSFSR